MSLSPKCLGPPRCPFRAPRLRLPRAGQRELSQVSRPVAAGPRSVKGVIEGGIMNRTGEGRTRSGPDWAEPFLEALARSGKIMRACATAEVSRAAVYARRDRDKSFRAA